MTSDMGRDMNRRNFLLRTSSLAAQSATPPWIGSSLASGFPSDAEIERLVDQIEKNIEAVDRAERGYIESHYGPDKGLSAHFPKDLAHGALVMNALATLPSKAQKHPAVCRLLEREGPRVAYSIETTTQLLRGLPKHERQRLGDVLGRLGAAKEHPRTLTRGFAAGPALAPAIESAMWAGADCLEPSNPGKALDALLDGLDRHRAAQGLDEAGWMPQLDATIRHEPWAHRMPASWRTPTSGVTGFVSHSKPEPRELAASSWEAEAKEKQARGKGIVKVGGIIAGAGAIQAAGGLVLTLTISGWLFLICFGGLVALGVGLLVMGIGGLTCWRGKRMENSPYLL
jgi:hypothetical protein